MHIVSEQLCQIRDLTYEACCESKNKPHIRSLEMKFFITIIIFVLGAASSYASRDWGTTINNINMKAKTFVSHAESDLYSNPDDPDFIGCESGLSPAAQQAFKIAKRASLNKCAEDKTLVGLCELKYLNYIIMSFGDKYKCFATVGYLKVEDSEKFFSGAPH